MVSHGRNGLNVAKKYRLHFVFGVHIFIECVLVSASVHISKCFWRTYTNASSSNEFIVHNNGCLLIFIIYTIEIQLINFCVGNIVSIKIIDVVFLLIGRKSNFVKCVISEVLIKMLRIFWFVWLQNGCCLRCEIISLLSFTLVSVVIESLHIFDGRRNYLRYNQVVLNPKWLY